MTIKTTTHLNFRGDARAALTFYRSVFGGELTAISYADAHAVGDPAEADQIIWGQVATEDGFHVMVYDVPSATPWNAGESPFFVSVRGDDADALARYWQKLCQDATVVQPMGPSGFSPLYGMVRDQFGISWVLDLEVDHAGA